MRSFRDELSATFIRVFAYIGAIAVIAVFAASYFASPSVEAAIGHAPRSEWAGVERPFRAFALTMPEFADPDPDYAIRRHGAGGGRKDTLVWGQPDGAGTRMMIEIYRPGSELQRFGDAATEVVARTASLGGPYALKPAEAIDSKFGRFTAFNFTATVAERRRSCMGFVRSYNEPRLQIAGWYCRGGLEVMDRGTAACALERLSLLMAASEPKVSELFAHAELKRKFCGQKPLARGGNTKRMDWIDGAKNPKLRGRVAGK